MSSTQARSRRKAEDLPIWALLSNCPQSLTHQLLLTSPWSECNHTVLPGNAGKRSLWAKCRGSKRRLHHWTTPRVCDMASLNLNKIEAVVLRKWVDQMFHRNQPSLPDTHNLKVQRLASDQFYSKKLHDITKDLSLLPGNSFIHSLIQEPDSSSGWFPLGSKMLKTIQIAHLRFSKPRGKRNGSSKKYLWLLMGEERTGCWKGHKWIPLCLFMLPSRGELS